MWSPDEIADALAAALQRHDSALREEQSVYGLDALDELDLHTIIARGLELGTQHSAPGTAPFGILREQPYPHEWHRKVRPATPVASPHSSSPHSSSSLPIPRDRQRCDLVLTPEPNQPLDDSLLNEKQRRKEEAELQGTLFESLSTSHLAPGAPSPAPGIASSPALAGEVPEALRGRRGSECAAHAIQPELAFWLELKTLGQYTNTSGLPGPNRTYSSQLTRNPIADLTKLAADDRIHHAAAAVILFAADEPTARHDLNILMQRARTKDLPITLSSPHLRTFPIPDRIGNTLCVVCIIALRKH